MYPNKYITPICQCEHGPFSCQFCATLKPASDALSSRAASATGNRISVQSICTTPRSHGQSTFEIIDGGLILSDLSHRMDESLLPFPLRDGLDYAFRFDPEHFHIFVWSIFKTKRFKTGSVRDSVCSANSFVLIKYY